MAKQKAEMKFKLKDYYEKIELLKEKKAIWDLKDKKAIWDFEQLEKKHKKDANK